MGRRAKEILIVLIVVALVAVFVRDSSVESRYPRVTMRLPEMGETEAAQRVCHKFGIDIVGLEPAEIGSEYRDEFEFVDNTIDEVFNRLVSDWKLVEDVLVVSGRHGALEQCRLRALEQVRVEYLLEEAPAQELLPRLKPAFPNVKFSPHPTMNGFYAAGNKKDLLTIKRMLSTIDRYPIPAFSAFARTHQPEWLEARELIEMLNSKFPKVTTKLVGTEVSLDGPLEETGNAIDFLEHLDRKTVEVSISRAQLLSAKPACSFYRPAATPTVSCPKTPCPGPLHLLGLKQGDILPAYRNDELRAKPEWWVIRDGKNYRIVLHLQP